VTSEPASPRPSGSVELTGTWSDQGAWQGILALHPCGPGEVCGRFELTVDEGAGPRCVYTLEHRPPSGGDYLYWTSEVGWLSFHCAYDYWHVELRVRPQPAGTVLVWQEGLPGRSSWTLSLVSDQYELSLP
jgi:hypothetical protein